ncbi:MAG: hypothetical protein IKO00_03425 [Oscillospiraceae bacterium]|nr:hypothetical protein [Oscillospiraceae bacterium]
MPTSVADMIALFPNKEGQDQTNVALLAIAGAIDRKNHSAGRLSFKELWMLNRMGLAHTVVAPGETQIEVMKETAINASVSGSITGAAVNEDTFIAMVGEVKEGNYEFSYNGAAWHLDGEPVDLGDYGITITGTPASGDLIEVHETAGVVTFDVAAIDQHRPANPALKHSISLLCTEAVAGFPYCPTQAAIVVKSGKLDKNVDYYVEIPADYDASYHTGGNYLSFRLSEDVPAGGQVMIPWAYQQQLANVKIATYTAFSTTPIESNVSVTVKSTVTQGTDYSLGSLTNGEIQEQTLAYSNSVVLLNNINRMRYGSNDARTSCMLQWLSSDAASGWHQQVSPFDRPQTTPTAGFLHGMDPEFLQIIGKVKLRSAFNTVCKSLAGESNTATYYDGEYLAWLPSMTELGWGANNGVIETSPNADGNVENKPLALFDGATNADRIRRNSGTARHWWLRSPHPSYAYNERYVYTDGSLRHDYAGNGYWAVPGLDII